MSNRIRSAIIVFISLIWAATFTAPIFVKGYTAPAEVHIIFMTIIAVLVQTNNGGGNQNDNEPRQ